MTEFEFTNDATRVQYARDKVAQYDAMVNTDPTAGYHWERTDPNGSKISHDLNPIETRQLANRAAFYLSQELNSIGVIYRGPAAEKDIPNGT